MFEAFDASSSALYAERTRMTAIANNLANVHTTRDQFGNKVPFRRKLLVQVAGNPNNSNPTLGTQVTRIVEDNSDFRLEYDPGHPDALRMADFFKTDENGISTNERLPEYANMDDAKFQEMTRRIGYVQKPNISPVMEMKDAMVAARSYEMNVQAIAISKSLITESLSIIA